MPNVENVLLIRTILVSPLLLTELLEATPNAYTRPNCYQTCATLSTNELCVACLSKYRDLKPSISEELTEAGTA